MLKNRVHLSRLCKSFSKTLDFESSKRIYFAKRSHMDVCVRILLP